MHRCTGAGAAEVLVHRCRHRKGGAEPVQRSRGMEEQRSRGMEEQRCRGAQTQIDGEVVQICRHGAVVQG